MPQFLREDVNRSVFWALPISMTVLISALNPDAPLIVCWGFGWKAFDSSGGYLTNYGPGWWTGSCYKSPVNLGSICRFIRVIHHSKSQILALPSAHTGFGDHWIGIFTTPNGPRMSCFQCFLFTIENHQWAVDSSMGTVVQIGAHCRPINF